jgi:arylsulfatase A-like enzyme
MTSLKQIGIAFSTALGISTCSHTGVEAADSGKQEKPNILFIAVDDLKPLLGCYGDSLVQSPNIDELANSGIVFRNNVCQQAVSAPSRASLLTGQYPDQLKVWDLQTVIREKNPGIVTLPQYLIKQGYETAGTGKIFDPRSLEGGWGGPHDPPSWSMDYTYPDDDMFSDVYGRPKYYYASAESKDTIAKIQQEARDNGYTSYNEIRNYVQERYWPPVESADVDYDAYIDGALCNNGIQLMEQLADQSSPFFLAVGFHRPHLPFVAPEKYWDLYPRDTFQTAAFQEQAANSPGIAYHNSGELRNGYTNIPQSGDFKKEKQLKLIHGYYAATSYIDDMVGKLMNKLESLGLADNTIVVLWGDHGWHLGDHGLWCKHSNFEQATKAPLIIKSPWQKKKGIQHFGPTEFTDIAPTLCDLAGIDIPVYFEGKSLEPLFENPDQDVREGALSQYPRNGKKYMGYSLRTRRYRYTKWIERATGDTYARELYDYKTDPLETNSLIGDEDYDTVVTRLDSLVDRRIKHPSTQAKIRFTIKGEDPEGSIIPISDADIEFAGYNSTTNSSGQLVLSHVPGKYQYTISKKGYFSITDNLDFASDTLITDTLKAKKVDVTFEAVDKNTQQSLDEYQLEINGADYNASNGKIILNDIMAGDYQISVKKNIMIH